MASATLRLVDPEGDPAGERTAPGEGPREYLKPSRIAAGRKGFLLQDRHRLLWLDSALEVARAVDLREAEAGPSALFQWDGADGSIWAYLHHRPNEEDWWTGFARVELEPSVAIERFLEIPSPSDETAFYSLPKSFVAQIGERGYLLRMEERPYVVEVGEKVRRLAAFPSGFDTRPTLPRPSAQAFSATQRLLEQAKTPIGLHAQGDHLYVLTREPVAGGTRWSLTKIDPRRDEVLHQVELPTRARDLVLAPGPHHWAIVEKGEARAVGFQQVESILFVPTPWVEKGRPPGTTSACPMR